MKKTNLVKLITAGAIATLLMTGCGGGGDEGEYNDGYTDSGYTDDGEYNDNSGDNTGDSDNEEGHFTQISAMEDLAGIYTGVINGENFTFILGKDFIAYESIDKDGKREVGTRLYERAGDVFLASYETIYGVNTDQYDQIRATSKSVGNGIGWDYMLLTPDREEYTKGDLFTITNGNISGDGIYTIPDGVVYHASKHEDKNFFAEVGENSFYVLDKDKRFLTGKLEKVELDLETEFSAIPGTYSTNFGGSNGTLILTVANDGIFSGTGTNIYTEDLNCNYAGEVDKNGEKGFFTFTMVEECPGVDSTRYPKMQGIMMEDKDTQSMSMIYSSLTGMGELTLSRQ